MADWDRSTPWRQGRMIPADILAALGLEPRTSSGTQLIGVVISHDCDITQDPETEPVVEAIVGRIIEKSEGHCTHAKNPRRLHLTCTGGSRTAIIELSGADKQAIPKTGIAGLCAHNPAPDLIFTTAECNILQRWLAARYRRAAFPDEFDRRLREEAGVWNALLKVIKPTDRHISAVFVDLDGGQQRERHGADDCYALVIYLLYDTAVDPAAAEKTAEKAAGKIKALFEKRCFINGKWRWIELVDCMPIADEALTYAQSQALRKWNLDYLSLREVPAGPIAE